MQAINYLVGRTLKDCGGDIDTFLLHSQRKGHAEAIAAVQRRLAWIAVTPFEDLGLRTWAIWNGQNELRSLKGHCRKCKKRW